jgi:hypothetical protein
MNTILIKINFIALFLLSYTYLIAQSYSFNNSISKEVLLNYLDKAISMQTLSAVEGIGNLPEVERQKDIAMLINTKAKFISRIGGWWENAYGQNKLDDFSKRFH